MNLWSDIVADRAAIHAATHLALRAYRALVGPITTLDHLATTHRGPPETLVAAVLSAWAGNCPEAVDASRAARLFWIHLVGPESFSEWFPDAPPVRWHERAAGDTDAPPWTRVERCPQARHPLSGLMSPWPTAVTLAMLGRVGLVDAIVPWSQGGTIRCAPDPDFSGTLGARQRRTPDAVQPSP